MKNSRETQRIRLAFNYSINTFRSIIVASLGHNRVSLAEWISLQKGV